MMRIGPVNRHLICLAFSSDGKTLAGAGASSRVWVWDVGTGREVLELGGPRQCGVGSGFFSRWQIAGNDDAARGRGAPLELPSGQPIATLKGHVQGVIGSRFSPDGKTLATASHDRKVKLWNVGHAPGTGYLPVCRACHLRALLARWTGVRHRLLERNVEYTSNLVRAPLFEEIAAAERNQNETANSPR